MESEFVTDQIDRLPLRGEGRWVDVKHELSAGETQDMFGHLLTDTAVGDAPTLRAERVMLAKITAYLVRWSFVGPDGQPIPVSDGAVRNLKASTFTEISEALTAHEAAVTAAQKKTNGGAPA